MGRLERQLPPNGASRDSEHDFRSPIREQRARLLLVEDDPDDVFLVREMIADARIDDAIGPRIELAAAVGRVGQAMHHLDDAPFDVALLDLSLPDSAGLRSFQLLHDRAPDVPIVILTGADDLQQALEAVQSGAQDYLVKSRVDADALVRSLRYAIERQRLMTELRHRLDEIRESDARFRHLLESSPDGIVVFDDERNAVYVNPVASSLLLDDSGEVLLGELPWPPNAGGVTELERGNRSVEVRGVETRWQSRHAYLVILRDVTRQRQGERYRRQLETRIHEQERLDSLGTLAAGVAHDFNNLLGVIQTGVSAARRAPASDGDVRACLEQIDEAARRAADLSNQLLIYAGRRTPPDGHVELSRIVDEMTDLLRWPLPSQVCLELELAPELPVFDGDPNQVRQMVFNLVVNAADAIGDQAGVITVRTGETSVDSAELEASYITRRGDGGRFVYLEVVDTGIGMDAPTRARVFEPFFTTKPAGRGFGMVAVLGCVRSHNGAIRIDTAPGSGTRVQVLFDARGAPSG